MFVFEWMTLKLYTVLPEDCICDALRIMKEMSIKHIPVVKEGNICGIVTDKDIKEFNPAKAVTFDMYELHYIFEKTKIKEVMKSPVYTTTSDTPIEVAADPAHRLSQDHSGSEQISEVPELDPFDPRVDDAGE